MSALERTLKQHLVSYHGAHKGNRVAYRHAWSVLVMAVFASDDDNELDYLLSNSVSNSSLDDDELLLVVRVIQSFCCVYVRTMSFAQNDS